MTLTTPRLLRATGMVSLLMASFAATTALADAESANVAPLAKYRQECAACHIAFPAGMLPASSWDKLMATLPKHFGTDASLDASSQREITAWLQSNAGTYRRVREEPLQNRITQSAWFLRQHRAGEVPASVWKRASVGSPSNCAACHTGAETGNFNEDDVRIPR
jgi:hypothetical protein